MLSGQQRNANILFKVVAVAQCATWDNVVYVWQGSISYSQSGHEWIQKSFVDPKNNLRTKISCDTLDYWVTLNYINCMLSDNINNKTASHGTFAHLTV